ncbi:MAG: anhydro-N-acetylmuramic acid kinase [Bacteroidetes bacterium]|nr:anhydro-N-acetylmuramic acid kinase [Bacteroidota bacterium]
MSGTSHDGLDLAHCIFRNDGESWSFEITHAETIAYGDEWKPKLLGLPKANSDTISKADQELGEYIGISVDHFISKHKLKPDFIASHGHTIFHDPSQKLTLQIGNGQLISSICRLPVVNDFRSSDVAMGGQGAPLVPLGDLLLFPDYDYCLNLGGIANISYDKEGERIAFDICPVNMLLNYLAEKAGKPYDNKGQMAAKGSIVPSLLEELEGLPFYAISGPRSLGREWVSENVFPLIKRFEYHSPQDLLATFTEHVAQRISVVLPYKTGRTMLITGGGAYNEFLVNRIKYHCDLQILIPDRLLIEYKEAMIFAFLGLLRLEGINNILGSVTGSAQDHCAGEINYPWQG